MGERERGARPLVGRDSVTWQTRYDRPARSDKRRTRLRSNRLQRCPHSPLNILSNIRNYLILRGTSTSYDRVSSATMSSKPKTTRSTAKTKPAATIPPPAASRTTRTATRSTPTPPLNDTVKKAAPRKPFANANRDNSPEGKGVAASGSQSKGLAKSSSYVTIADEGDREPIRVRSYTISNIEMSSIAVHRHSFAYGRKLGKKMRRFSPSHTLSLSPRQQCACPTHPSPRRCRHLGCQPCRRPPSTHSRTSSLQQPPSLNSSPRLLCPS